MPDAFSSEDHLPPVEPPSAGFIVQLFVVPAVIVLAIVGVWLLFGKMAAGDQNWQSLIAELEVPPDQANAHRRDRAALMLAQMLSAAQARTDHGDEAAPPLTENVQLAEALGRVYRKRLSESPKSEAWHLQQLYLSRALGMLDVPEALPPLQLGTSPANDPEVRRNALIEIAVIANRAAEKEPERLAKMTADRALEDDLIAASTADEPAVRHVAAYALGLFPTDASRARLEVLLNNADDSTRANAAIGLARQKSTAGVPVFEEIFANAAEPPVVVAEAEEEAGPRLNLHWMAILGILAVAATVWGAFELRWRRPVADEEKAAGRRFRVRVGLAMLTGLAILIVLAEPPATTTESPLRESPSASRAESPATAPAPDPADLTANFESLVSLRASLKAVRELADEFDSDERSRLSELLHSLVEKHRFAEIRSDARDALAAIEHAETE
ncbi:MAG: HEAT repeat domain-containing protein [Planctomycetaceae bacterium]